MTIDRNNSGVLNHNEKFGLSREPLWQGYLTVDGKDYRVYGFVSHKAGTGREQIVLRVNPKGQSWSHDIRDACAAPTDQ